MVDTKEVSQDDIESIRRSDDSAPPGVEDRREVVVTVVFLSYSTRVHLYTI